LEFVGYFTCTPLYFALILIPSTRKRRQRCEGYEAVTPCVSIPVSRLGSTRQQYPNTDHFINIQVAHRSVGRRVRSGYNRGTLLRLWKPDLRGHCFAEAAKLNNVAGACQNLKLPCRSKAHPVDQGAAITSLQFYRSNGSIRCTPEVKTHWCFAEQ